MLDNLKSRITIWNILMVILVINFLFLLVALTDFIEGNPKDYRFVLGISFIALAGFARRICKHCGKGPGGREES